MPKARNPSLMCKNLLNSTRFTDPISCVGSKYVVWPNSHRVWPYIFWMVTAVSHLLYVTVNCDLSLNNFLSRVATYSLEISFFCGKTEELGRKILTLWWESQSWTLVAREFLAVVAFHLPWARCCCEHADLLVLPSWWGGVSACISQSS